MTTLKRIETGNYPEAVAVLSLVMEHGAMGLGGLSRRMGRRPSSEVLDLVALGALEWIDGRGYDLSVGHVNIHATLGGYGTPVA